mgnify:CR=1 FL=1
MKYKKTIIIDRKKSQIQERLFLRNEKINYKVREHSLAKVPFIIVCGKKDKADNMIGEPLDILECTQNGIVTNTLLKQFVY